MAQAIEGRHYYRSVRLHKQSFEALIRYRMRKNNVSTNFDNSTTSPELILQNTDNTLAISNPIINNNINKIIIIIVIIIILQEWLASQIQRVFLI